MAVAEKGEQLLDQGAGAFCELLTEVDNFDVNRLAKGPLG
jgi:creatinine amidohydrolase